MDDQIVSQFRQVIREEVDGIITDKLEPVKEYLAELAENYTALRITVDAHTGSLIDIERKIDALFDGYSLNSEKLTEHSERLIVVESQVGITPTS